MALSNELGLVPMMIDQLLTSAGAAPALATGAVIDATAEKIAFIGPVWHPTVKTGTINIRKVHFRCGAITITAAQSEFRVSLQNLSATAGPPYQPDGTQDQFYDFKLATTGLTANAWNITGNLSADRAVNLASDSTTDANSRRLAVVFEYQVFTAADSVIVSGLSNVTSFLGFAGTGLNTGSWAQLASTAPILALECDDGTFAFMQGATPTAATGNVSVSSTGAIRRAGVKFRFPSERSIDRFSLAVRLPNGADGRLVLYDSDGTTELRSVDVDNDEVRSATSDAYLEALVEPVTLLANTYYRLAYVGGTATNALAYYVDVNAAALMDGFILGQNAHWTDADSAGTWTDTTTRRPVFGLGVCAYHAAGGGLLVHPGMTGGLRG